MLILAFILDPRWDPAFAEDTVYLTMRDGKQLKTTIYRPGGGGYPVVLCFGHGYFCEHDRFNVAGYAVVKTDYRDLQFHQDIEDSYDIIDWISNQSWCNGKVAMFGLSRGGATSWGGAVCEHPP